MQTTADTTTTLVLTAFEAVQQAAKAELSKFTAANPGATPEQAFKFLSTVQRRLVSEARAAIEAERKASAQTVQAAAPAKASKLHVRRTKQAPAVPVAQSVQDDYIVCLEDGSKHQMMKRYLKRVFDLTPDQYRARWGLAEDYPMTAPGYSARKRLEAYAVGLGTHENKAGLSRGAAWLPSDVVPAEAVT